ncbi:hypothetical protein KCU83_g628, partial [Aureobasidium melanogenum]
MKLRQEQASHCVELNMEESHRKPRVAHRYLMVTTCGAPYITEPHTVSNQSDQSSRRRQRRVSLVGILCSPGSVLRRLASSGCCYRVPLSGRTVVCSHVSLSPISVLLCLDRSFEMVESLRTGQMSAWSLAGGFVPFRVAVLVSMFNTALPSYTHYLLHTLSLPKSLVAVAILSIP